jgi:hypothetical protein
MDQIAVHFAHSHVGFSFRAPLKDTLTTSSASSSINRTYPHPAKATNNGNMLMEGDSV